MVANKHLFRAIGVNDAEIAGLLTPGYTVSSSVQVPPAFQVKDLQPDNGPGGVALEDLKFAMAEQGWSYVGPSDAPSAKTIGQLVRFALPADAASPILAASGWQDIGVQVALTTKGGSEFDVEVAALLGVAVGGAVRVLINGGSFSNVVIGPDFASAPLLSGSSPVAFAASVPIPVTGTDTTYTLRLQAQGVGGLALVTARKGSQLKVAEFM